MYGIIFFLTYIFFSYFCYFIDINYPNKRIKYETPERIKNDYKIMLPQVSLNVGIGTFILQICNNITIHNNNYSFFINFILWFFLSDLFFYTIHRILHTKIMFFLHEKHHEYFYTYGIGAIYSSWFEFIFGNLLPLILPIYLISSPYNFNCFIIFFSTFYTIVISHGCYIKSNSHFKHHQKRITNFGLGIMDRLFNTY